MIHMHRGSRLRKVGQAEPVQDRMSRLDRVEVSQQVAQQEQQSHATQPSLGQQPQQEQQPSFLKGMANFYSGVAKGVQRKFAEQHDV